MSLQETKFPSEKDLFKSIVDSAFEFLNKAIDEFQSSSKFSTVHFAIAIELFLKARLMQEHWSLLVEKTDLADKASFFKGELRTVSPEQAIQRLKKIANSPILDRSKSIFLKIAKHRNKLVHFVHQEETSIQESDELIGKIALEQCAGWLELRVLLEKWDVFFVDYKSEIKNVSEKMERHREYLEELFKSKAEEIKNHESIPLGYVSYCPCCSFKALLCFDIGSSLFPSSCAVCRYKGVDIEIICQYIDCEQMIHFSSWEGAPTTCPHCETSIDEDYFEDALNTEVISKKDSHEAVMPINCPDCNSLGSVVKHEEYYVCSNCFEISNKIEYCDWCSEGQLDRVQENSFMTGCDFCDGSYKDD